MVGIVRVREGRDDVGCAGNALAGRSCCPDGFGAATRRRRVDATRTAALVRLADERRRGAAGGDCAARGHGSTKVTETVYRKQLRPVLTGGAQVMDTLFDLPQGEGRDLSSGS